MQNTLVSIFDSSYYIGFMAIGVTFVIITGGIDLSIGTVCICCSLISGTLFTKLGLPMPLCVILAILMGGLFGLANGLMVSVMRLPAFIATLGTMMITRGLGSIVTNTATVTFPQASAPGGSFRGIFKLKGAGLPQAGNPAQQGASGTLYIVPGEQQGGDPAFRCKCGKVGDFGLCHKRSVCRAGRRVLCSSIFHTHAWNRKWI